MKNQLFKKRRSYNGVIILALIIILGLSLGSLELAKHIPPGLAKIQQQQAQ
jgi:hypothetical protein